MKTYLISELADDLITTKSRVSRSISKLKIEAVNENDRIHKNSPKKYDSSAKNLVEIDLMSVTERSEAQQDSLRERIKIIKGKKATDKENIEEKKPKEDQSTTTTKTERYEAHQEIIDVLKTQLKKANDEKDGLMRLLDQQQKIALYDRNRIKTLEIELEEVAVKEEIDSEKKEAIKPKWYNFFKPNK